MKRLALVGGMLATALLIACGMYRALRICEQNVPAYEYNPATYSPVIDNQGHQIGRSRVRGTICTFYIDGQYHPDSEPHDLTAECVENGTDPSLNLSFITAPRASGPEDGKK